MNKVRAYIHPSGLRFILTENGVSESCAASLMIRVGSIYEPPPLHGGSHIIEHMMFRGTSGMPNKSQLSETLDEMGASYNAYTDYTMTCYHIKVQKKYIGKAIQMLCDMVSDSVFHKKDLGSELNVVVEELRRERDDPASYISELYYQTIFQGTPFGLSIGGTQEEVLATKYKDLREFWLRHYILQNMVLSVSGDLSIGDIQQAVNRSQLLLGNLQSHPPNAFLIRNVPQVHPRLNIQYRKTMQQVQVTLGFPVPFGLDHPDRFVLYVMKTILGGNMSSRLFIEMRDVYGIAYSVHASVGLFDTTGEFSVSSGVDGSGLLTGNLDEKNKKVKGDAIAIILRQLYRIREERVPAKELHKAKEYIIGTTLLDLEDHATVAEFYGKQLLHHRKVLTPQQYLAEIKKVTADDIHRVAQLILRPHAFNLVLIGKVDLAKAKQYVKDTMSQWIHTLEKNTASSISLPTSTSLPTSPTTSTVPSSLTSSTIQSNPLRWFGL